MCLPFSFQGRAKVSLKNNYDKIEIVRKFWDIWGFLETLRIFRDFWKDF